MTKILYLSLLLIKNLFNVMKDYYYALLYFGDDSSKVILTLDQIDSVLKTGHTVEIIDRVYFLITD